MYAIELSARRDESGSTLVASLVLATVLSSLCLLMVASSMSQVTRAKTHLGDAKAFYVAEAGVDFCMARMADDMFWASSSTTHFPEVQADGSFRSGWHPMGDSGGDFRLTVAYQTKNDLPAGWSGSGFPAGFQPTSTVVFASRSDTPSFQRVVVTAEGRNGTQTRRVSANVKLVFSAYQAAIVADNPAISTTGSGKGLAKDGGNVVFNGVNQHVHGGIRANAGVYVDSSTTPLTTENASTEMGTFTGGVRSNLIGGLDEVPDFTDPGSQQQLFDFDRFKFAAKAGAGSYHGSLQAFVTAMNAANDNNLPLEGIVFVTIDAAVEGKNPKLKDAAGGKKKKKGSEYAIPKGINVVGTLVFNFENASDSFYKVFIETPLNINKAPLPTPFDPANAAHLTSGYPPVYTQGQDPRGYALNSATYPDFGMDDDLPALMFDNGTVDIHHRTNVSGAVYGPSFIEIENQHGELMYFNGVMVGGGGVYLKGHADNPQVFVFNPSAVDNLPTYLDQGKTPIIDDYSIAE